MSNSCAATMSCFHDNAGSCARILPSPTPCLLTTAEPILASVVARLPCSQHLLFSKCLTQIVSVFIALLSMSEFLVYIILIERFHQKMYVVKKIISPRVI